MSLQPVVIPLANTSLKVSEEKRLKRGKGEERGGDRSLTTTLIRVSRASDSFDLWFKVSRALISDSRL
ncbi:hypothetical protein HanPI659440_Chr10g0378881 [Helianthus annuus]|nr:hypothetical protein HanPI659440_Chr10g0378881 [Helianthus annuus]